MMQETRIKIKKEHDASVIGFKQHVFRFKIKEIAVIIIYKCTEVRARGEEDGLCQTKTCVE